MNLMKLNEIAVTVVNLLSEKSVTIQDANTILDRARNIIILESIVKKIE